MQRTRIASLVLGTALAAAACAEVPTDVLEDEATVGSGLRATYFTDARLATQRLIRRDTTIDFDWGAGAPDDRLPADGFSVRWEGSVLPRYSETYTLHLVSDEGVRLWIDGRLVIDHWAAHSWTEDRATVSLRAGRAHALRLEYYDREGNATVRLGWSSRSQDREPIPTSQLRPPMTESADGGTRGTDGGSDASSGLTDAGRDATDGSVTAPDAAVDAAAPDTAVPDAGEPVEALPGAVCGTWVLQQVSSLADLDRLRPAIESALSVPGVRGFSLRVPWTAIDRDLTVLDRGREIARARGVDYSVRFMAGRWTPARVFDAGAYHYTLPNGERVPKPFSDSGVAGNPVFEREFDAATRRLATYARANGIRLLHLPWYGQKWAEIDNGPEIVASRGYSWEAWLAGHQRLVDLGLAVADARLAVEFPLSGHWTQPNGGQSLVRYMVAEAGTLSPRIFIQGNGLGRYDGKPSRELLHGMQMYDGGDYDWDALYTTLESAPRASYVEVYTPSFSGPGRAALATNIARFARNCP